MKPSSSSFYRRAESASQSSAGHKKPEGTYKRPRTPSLCFCQKIRDWRSDTRANVLQRLWLRTNARPEYASNVSGLSGVIVSEIVDGRNCSCDSLKCFKIDTSLHGRSVEGNRRNWLTSRSAVGKFYIIYLFLANIFESNGKQMKSRMAQSRSSRCQAPLYYYCCCRE